MIFFGWEKDRPLGRGLSLVKCVCFAQMYNFFAIDFGGGHVDYLLPYIFNAIMDVFDKTEEFRRTFS